MQVQSGNSTTGAGLSAGTSDNKKTDDAFAELLAGETPEEMLHEMTKDGMYSLWSHQLKELKKKIAAEIMGGMGVSEASLKAMPADERAAIEKKIMEEVERRVKEMVENEMKKKNPLAGISPGAPVDSATMGGLLGISE